MSAVLNGANEVVVDAFLHEKILGAIARLVEETIQAVPVIAHPTLEQVFECDRAARQKRRRCWRAWRITRRCFRFMYVVLALLLLGVLIIAHEGGHFWRRACGIGVQEFSMGMGPLIAKWQSKRERSFPCACCPSAAVCQF